MPRIAPPHCYYCNSVFSVADVSGYERHVVNNHVGRPAYPSWGDIHVNKLRTQNMYWEIPESEALEIIRNYKSKKRLKNQHQNDKS